MTSIENRLNKQEARTANSTYNKLAVQWLNEALCPDNYRDFVVADPPQADAWKSPNSCSCIPLAVIAERPQTDT